MDFDNAVLSIEFYVIRDLLRRNKLILKYTALGQRRKPLTETLFNRFSNPAQIIKHISWSRFCDRNSSTGILNMQHDFHSTLIILNIASEYYLVSTNSHWVFCLYNNNLPLLIEIHYFDGLIAVHSHCD